MKNFCDSLREHAKNITDFEKKQMLSLTREELISYQHAEVCYIWESKILKMFSEDINYPKVRLIVIMYVNIGSHALSSHFYVNIGAQHILFVI